MVRPKRGFPVRAVHVRLPEALMQQLDALLYNPEKGGVPMNAYTSYFTDLLRRQLLKDGKAADLNELLKGNPDGTV